MKKKILFILIIILVLISMIGIVGLIIYSNDQLHFKLSYEYINYMEYDNGKRIKVSIPMDNRIKYVSNDELLDILYNGTGIIYFGYNTCPWCRNAIPVLIDTVKENKIETIYYADIHKLDLSSIKDDLYSKLDIYLQEEDGEKVFSVPGVYFVENGNVVCGHIGTIDSYHNPYRKMTDEQIKELSDIYNDCIWEME